MYLKTIDTFKVKKESDVQVDLPKVGPFGVYA